MSSAPNTNSWRPTSHQQLRGPKCPRRKNNSSGSGSNLDGPKVPRTNGPFLIAFQFDTSDMATGPDYPSGHRIGPQTELLTLRRRNEVGRQWALSLGVFEEKRAVSVRVVFLV